MNKIICFFLFFTCHLFSQKVQIFEYDFSLENEKSLCEIKTEKKNTIGNAYMKIVFKDFEDKPVALARITSLDLDNNQSFSSLSDINGLSNLNLTPGRYSVKIEHIQFTKIEISEINIRKGYQFNINVILGYAWTNNAEGFGTIFTETKLSKKDLKEIVKDLSKNSKIRKVNGIKFTVSWQI